MALRNVCSRGKDSHTVWENVSGQRYHSYHETSFPKRHSGIGFSDLQIVNGTSITKERSLFWVGSDRLTLFRDELGIFSHTTAWFVIYDSNMWRADLIVWTVYFAEDCQYAFPKFSNFGLLLKIRTMTHIQQLMLFCVLFYKINQ